MSNSKYKEIISRWNDPNKDHNAIITNPPNTITNDLILTSKVHVQSFFSLHKHQYHYIADNGSDANGVYCNMRIDWKGPGITSTVSPTLPFNLKPQSFFSPQKITTSVDVQAIAGNIPFSARSVVAEQADCYVPWNRSVWKPLKKVIRTVKELILISSLLIGDENEVLRIESRVEAMSDSYLYGLTITSGNESEITGKLSLADYDSESLSFNVPPGDSQDGTSESSMMPGEVWGYFEALTPLQGVFPIALIIPKKDVN